MISLARNLARALAACLVFCLLPNYGQQDSSVTIQAESLILSEEDSLLAELQSYAELTRMTYGLDQTLLNGLRYFNVYEFPVKNPYFLLDSASSWSLILNGQTYENVHVKFDICSHHLELDYPNPYGGSGRIFLVADQVDGFSIGENHFEKLDIEKGGAKYYQVIRTNCFVTYVLWEGHAGGSTYTAEPKSMDEILYLQVDTSLTKFKRRGDFAEFFQAEYRKEIKRFLRKNSFQFRSASPAEMRENLNSVCTLLEEKETL